MSAPWQICSEAEAPTSTFDQQTYITRPPAWQNGITGHPLPVTPATDSGVLTMVLAIIVLIGVNMTGAKRMFGTLSTDLMSVRRRSNAFNEHTLHETRLTIILLLQLWVFEGVMLYLWLANPGYTTATLHISYKVGLLAAISAALYLFQLVGCMTIGYVFTDKTYAMIWRKGLNASQMLLGIALMLPTLISLFYPAALSITIPAAATLFVLFRLMYIYKGFRIFYTNFSSLIYFILYLCTLEIIPVVITCHYAMQICVKG